MGALSWWHWAIVLVVLVVLFGSKKLPEAARGLGRSMRIFKSEMAEMANDGDDKSKADPSVDAPHELKAGKSDVDVNVNVTDETKKSA
ncbi:Sec-independent protein translocase subunit TatA [Gordonia sp. HY002]|uniref:Sec-independent protein translocase subunit TatA n=1 Tax=Gordonia zhenghanii TaxID=2911516 RepID=UPI001EF01071|nr:Sec-independent protein translocase subunit TatA [Gordonia zhenghanii]MCF8569861.1 Sec-independent protein translocase subunit TatA [Gordonia zhenghanii]MCF8602455.1 Sec-independent protein translocase subunit TatA [Gordonia zhenghanii]